LKRVLMVAFHFPPLAGSSGIQRTLRFVQHLPAFGWQPLVLSAHPRVYEQTSGDLMGEIPDGTIVRRAFALDTARHLSLMGRYAGWMSRPDRWVSWKLGGVIDGIRMIKEYKVDVIWSTYPIATAHIIGAVLHRKSGIPWIADFRDLWIGESSNGLSTNFKISLQRKHLRSASGVTGPVSGAVDSVGPVVHDAADTALNVGDTHGATEGGLADSGGTGAGWGCAGAGCAGSGCSDLGGALESACTSPFFVSKIIVSSDARCGGAAS